MEPEQNQTPTMVFPTYNMKQESKVENGQVMENKGKLDVLIQELNDKLVTHFKHKEETLLNQYRQQLIQQQRTLNDLKNTTNEQQIRNKMIERKNQLQRERNHLIQTNMFFSQKCQQYKQTYGKLLQQSKDLERQLKFLDQQMQAATTKKLALTDEVYSQEVPMFTAQKKKVDLQGSINKTQQLSTLQKTKKSSSLKKIGSSLNIKKMKGREDTVISLKSKKKFDGKALEKTILEKLFEESVEQVRQRRKLKRTMPNIKGQEFTEFEKKAIMEIFLGNEQVKKRIYQIIFTDDKNNKNRFSNNQKVKISFDQIGI